MKAPDGTTVRLLPGDRVKIQTLVPVVGTVRRLADEPRCPGHGCARWLIDVEGTDQEACEIDLIWLGRKPR